MKYEIGNRKLTKSIKSIKIIEDRFSENAKRKIEAVGGSIVWMVKE
jgi:ribosomal protein L15